MPRTAITGLANIAAILPASPGVMTPAASAAVTAFMARAMSAALSIGGSANLTERSRQGGRMRSIQSRIAVGSPASAISTARRVKPSASPSSSTAAASVFLLRAPAGRPAGWPDRPFANGRPVPAPVLVKAHQPLSSPWVRPPSHFTRSGRRRCYLGDFIFAKMAICGDVTKPPAPVRALSPIVHTWQNDRATCCDEYIRRLLMIRFPFERAMGALLLMLTAILSLMMIHSPGTSDVSTVLNWTEVLYSNGLVAGYSTIISDFYTEYPPIFHAILYIARTFGATAGLSPLMSFKVTTLAFQLMSTGLILLLSRSYWTAAAFNGSLLLGGVSLGYQDVWLAPPLIAAFWAFEARRDVLGTALFVIACLIKWQPLIVAPFVAIYLFEISNLQSCRKAFGRILFWNLVILVTITVALLTIIFGLAPARSLWHGMNHPHWSGTALNLPWMAEFFRELLFSSSSSWQNELQVLKPSAIYLLPVKIIFWIVFTTIIISAIRADKTFTNCLLFSIIGLVTYVIWNSGVHENHLSQLFWHTCLCCISALASIGQ
jgi:hypothetical protein